ncbi:MAG: hypothetical protein HY660_17350 [Armatimonadetes bacterium]|nr:hypothetical protein [Armatimonadota bacterium]
MEWVIPASVAVIALACLVVAGVLVPTLRQARRTAAQAERLLERLATEVPALAATARETLEQVRGEVLPAVATARQVMEATRQEVLPLVGTLRQAVEEVRAQAVPLGATARRTLEELRGEVIPMVSTMRDTVNNLSAASTQVVDLSRKLAMVEELLDALVKAIDGIRVSIIQVGRDVIVPQVASAAGLVAGIREGLQTLLRGQKPDDQRRDA